MSRIALVLIKRYALSAILAIALGAAGWSHYWMYSLGEDSCKLDFQEELDKSLAAQAILADKLEEARNEERIVHKETIREIRLVPDPSGCRNVDVPDSVLEALGYSED